MTSRERIALTLCLVLPGVFVVYEAAALTGVAPWHTISYYALHDFRLDVAVIVLSIVALAVFLWWWIFKHMRSRIVR